MAADLNALKQDLTRRMDGALETLRKEFGGLRTGRASPGLLEPVRVEAYGTEVPLTQVGTIGVPEPRMLTVQVWDRTLVGAVERAIRDFGLGLNPASGRRRPGAMPRAPRSRCAACGAMAWTRSRRSRRSTRSARMTAAAGRTRCRS